MTKSKWDGGDTQWALTPLLRSPAGRGRGGAIHRKMKRKGVVAASEYGWNLNLSSKGADSEGGAGETALLTQNSPGEHGRGQFPAEM